MVLLGVLAIRLQSLHKPLYWDGPSMRFTNIHENDKIKVIASNQFSRRNGRPVFDNQSLEINAIKASQEFIRHTYRKGWNLPVELQDI